MFNYLQKFEKDTTIVISFSGGLTSAFMTLLLYDLLPHHNFVIVFANTGLEHENTLKFIHDFSEFYNIPIRWIECAAPLEENKGLHFQVVNYETANRNGKPMEIAIAKYGIPNVSAPHCSTSTKATPIHKYIKSLKLKKYLHCIGIRKDEASRVVFKDVNPNKLIYPLITHFPSTSEMVLDFWRTQKIKLDIPPRLGNCVMCFKKSKRKLLTNLKENPACGDWYQKMIDLYADTSADTFFREYATIHDLRKECETYKGFDFADNRFTQTSLFSAPTIDDLEQPCNCVRSFGNFS